MIRVAIVGAAGRMGRMLVTGVMLDPELALSGALEYSGCPLLGQDAGVVAGQSAAGVRITDNIEDFIANTDAVIDFSSQASTMALAPRLAAAGVNIAIGTTGLTDGDKAALRSLTAAGAKIVQAPIMSIGVNLLFALCAKVAPLLGEDYDIEVVEMHHNKKKDAPSGTAERVGDILAKARGTDLRLRHAPWSCRHGRRPQKGRHRHARPAWRRCGRRPHGDFRCGRRAGGIDAQGVESRDLRQGRIARGQISGNGQGGSIRYAGRAGSEGFLTNFGGASACPWRIAAVLD